MARLSGIGAAAAIGTGAGVVAAVVVVVVGSGARTMGSSTATTAVRGNAPAGVCARAGATTSDAPQANPAARRTSTGANAVHRRRPRRVGYSRAATQSARPSVYQAVTAAAASHVAASMMASPSPATVAVSVGRVAVRATIATAVSNERSADPSHDAAPYEII